MRSLFLPEPMGTFHETGVLHNKILYNEGTTYRKEWDHEANHEGKAA